MKVIVYETESGGVAICKPAYGDRLIQKWNMSEDEILAFVLEKDVPKGVCYKIVESSDLPQLNRAHRQDWKFCVKDAIKVEPA